MKTVAVVPMKLNNRRLPQKNTKRFTDGEPLCSYALTTALNTQGIDEVYVYCSNEQIKDYVPKGVKYLKRDCALDQDTTSMNEVLINFAREVDATIYVLIHVTAPFISCESIEKGIVAVKNEGYDSSFSVKKIQEFIWENGKPFNYDLDNIPRTQDLKVLFQETSGFYIFRKEVLIEHGRRIGENPLMIEVGEIEAVDIDEEEDFMIANALNYYRTKKRGGVVKPRCIFIYTTCVMEVA